MLQAIDFLICMFRGTRKQESYLRECPILITLKNLFATTSKTGCAGFAMTLGSRTSVSISQRGAKLFA